MVSSLNKTCRLDMMFLAVDKILKIPVNSKILELWKKVMKKVRHV